MKYLILLLMLVPCLSFADTDQVIVDAGLGVFSSKGHSFSQDKFAKIGIQEDLWNAFKQRFNTGGWIDTSGEGRTSSAFVGYQLGFEVKNDLFIGSVWTGPSVITSPDEVLGGPIQFNETVFFGLADIKNNAIGLAYNHFSSASLYTPNLGRDYMCLEIKFPF